MQKHATETDEVKTRRLPSSTINSPETTSPVLLRCIPQKPFVYDNFLPQLRVATSLQSNRPSLQPENPDSTRGLGPFHPIIREWNDKRAISITASRQKHVSPTSGAFKSSPLQYYCTDKGAEGYVRSSQLVAAVLGGRNDKFGDGNDKEVSDDGSLHSPATPHESTTDLADDIASVGRKQTNVHKRTVRFAKEEDLRKRTSPAILLTAGKPARASRHSHTLTYPSTACDERSTDSIFSSVASLASLTDCETNKNSLTSLPSLPLIQTNKRLSTTSSSSFLQKHLSRDDMISSMTGVESEIGKKEPHCSVINLRIPSGKVEEWDVPQTKIPIQTNTVASGESQQSKNSGSGSGTTNNQATLRKLEFIVFSDLPKQHISSTSSLVASVVQSHQSSHVSPRLHSNHGFSQDHTHSSGVVADRCIGAKGDKFPENKDTAQVQERATAAIETSQFLPHTLQYRHLLPQQRSSLPARLVELTSSPERDHPNPSMYIRSYSGSQPVDHCNSIRINKEHVSDDVLSHSLTEAKQTSTSSRIYSRSEHSGTEGSNCSALRSPRRHRQQAIRGGSVDGEFKKKQIKRKTSDDNGFDYPDPLTNCSSRYHHRLLKMVALVSQTVCHEHSRRRRKRQHSH